MGDFNTPLTSMDRSSRQKINKETANLNNTIDQIYPADLYRKFYPNSTRIHTLLKTNEALSRRGCILDHKVSFRKFKKNEIISDIFSDHNCMKIKTYNRRKSK